MASSHYHDRAVAYVTLDRQLQQEASVLLADLMAMDDPDQRRHLVLDALRKAASDGYGLRAEAAAMPSGDE